MVVRYLTPSPYRFRRTRKYLVDAEIISIQSIAIAVDCTFAQSIITWFYHAQKHFTEQPHLILCVVRAHNTPVANIILSMESEEK